MKKILSTLLVFLTTIFLVSCQRDNYFIYFDVQGGTPEVAKQVVKSGEFANHPEEEVTKEGYSFAFWYDRETSEQFMFEITEVRKDYILEAYWNELPGDGNGGTDEVNEYIVSFVSFDNNNKTTNITIKEGSTVIKPTDPMKDNHIFKGWYTDIQLTNVFDFNSAITSNLTVYGKWDKVEVPLKEYKVKYITNGANEVKDEIITEGNKLLKPTDPVKDRYIFVGWYSDITLLKEYDFGQILISDLTLYAKWQEVEVEKKTFNIKYDSNGGSLVSNGTVIEGDLINKPINPTKTDFTFVGWYIDSELTTEFKFTEVIFVDITLYAKWSEIDEEQSYRISYNTYGGSRYTDKVVKHGELAPALPDPTKDNYIFDDWYLDGDLTTKFNPNMPITSNLTLHAKWELYIEYRVSFDTDGGTSIKDQKIPVNQKASKPNTPIKVDYEFLGWYTSSDFTEEFDFGTIITENIIIYAKWKFEVKYTVSFESRGGSNIADVKINEGKKITKPNNPTMSKFVFDGWYTDIETTKLYDFDNPVQNDFTLYAKWREREQGDIHDYYKGYGIEDAVGNDLIDALKTRLEDGANFRSYGGNLNPLLVDADKHPTKPGNVYTIYDGEAMGNGASGSSGALVWNKEHVMPQSWYTGTYGRKGDLQNLRVARASINTARGNLSFAQGSGIWSKVSGGFYPGDGHQGDSARIAMYMIVMYPKAIPVSKAFAGSNPVQTMLRWHNEDPVDDFEIRRNEVLFGYQKNRNPFIDHPELAELIWGGLTQQLTQETKLSNLISSINLVTDIVVNQEVYVPNTRFYF